MFISLFFLTRDGPPDNEELTFLFGIEKAIGSGGLWWRSVLKPVDGLDTTVYMVPLSIYSSILRAPMYIGTSVPFDLRAAMLLTGTRAVLRKTHLSSVGFDGIAGSIHGRATQQRPAVRCFQC